MNHSNVTVFLEVFNEELRIESCLKSFLWADEIIVFDKQSTDRTCEIAKEYATKVINIPFEHGSKSVIGLIAELESCEWVMFPTA